LSTYDVRMWAIRKRQRRMPYQVRWSVAGRMFAESFGTKALAESFRSQLISATRSGEPFDEVTGLPESRARDVGWLDHAISYVDVKWPRAAAKSRKSTAEALTTVTLALVVGRRDRPAEPVLREALYGWAFNAGRRAGGEPPREIADALVWAGKSVRPVSALRDLSVTRGVLDALAVRLDGRPAAATTVYRKRAVFYNALGLAVERRLLPANPIDQVQWSAPEVAQAVDRRVVAGPNQVWALLDAVREAGRRGDHLVAFFGCLYFAGMRPGEAVALRVDQCVLPAEGWGRVELTTSEPRAGAAWTDDGEARESRELKRRSVAEVRPVPTPPELVDLLRRHLDRYGAAADGRLFRSGDGGPLQESTYRQVWAKARGLALTEAQAASPLVRRPYDLRHGAASLWLNAGVQPTEVARRLGHSVAVLLRVYANCVDGDQDVVNERIALALSPGAGRGRLAPASVEQHGPEPACGPYADQSEATSDG
jgi:integrase